jgi:hypothetical protein
MILVLHRQDPARQTRFSNDRLERARRIARHESINYHLIPGVYVRSRADFKRINAYITASFVARNRPDHQPQVVPKGVPPPCSQLRLASFI